MRSFRFFRPMAVVLGASLTLSTLAPSAQAAVLYAEDFSDADLPANTSIEKAEVAGGVLNVNDDLITNKGLINVVESFTSPLMTFSFDVVEPVVALAGGTQTELLFRAGRGTGDSSIGSADDIIELVLNRDTVNRGGYLNNGNESVFIVANYNYSEAGSTVKNFASPVDGSNVALDNQQFAVFIRNNDDGSFIRATPNAVNGTPGTFQLAEPITRFFIGSGSNADQNTVSLDNIGVVNEVSFQTVAVPEPSALALLSLGALATVRRRRA